ncbi:MAG: glycosyltransferase involved in cell wall biosynthesis [Flavobacteriales bacterium]
MSLNNTLHFFTNGFPFGKGEQFITDEIPLLANAFDEIVIYVSPSFGAISPLNYELPPNIIVKRVDFDQYIPVKNRAWKAVLLLAYEMFHSKQKSKYLFHLKKHWFIALEIVGQAMQLKEQFESSPTICYTYWFDHWTNVLAVAKRHYFPTLKLVTRAHGFDLDARQVPRGYYPFRNHTLSQLNNIVAVSSVGEKLLIQDNPKYAGIITREYLGVNTFGVCNTHQKKEEEFTIVSCSALIPLKRVDKIIEILDKVRLSVTWVHFGDGPEYTHVKKLAKQLPSNIQVVWKGHVSNNEILKFYKHYWVDAFIHLSSLEGIPIALMEAAAFGIPLFAVDTGGVKEVVNEQTGVLLQEEDLSINAANLLTKLLKNNAQNYAFRAEISAYIKSIFYAQSNHQLFINKYLK